MKRREGYVLLLVIMIISMMSILITRLVVKLTVFNRLTDVLVKREQAKLLAWSGVEMALSQLCARMPKAESESQVARTLFELRKLMTVCNRWQKVSFQEEIDGIEGTCAFYVTCEGGKLNPNGLYQADKRAVLDHPALTALNEALTKRLAAWGRDLNILKRIEAVMRTRAEPLRDVSELLQDEQLKKLQTLLFLSPDRDFALTDLFSVEREGITLQPWVLSASIAQAFDLHLTDTITDAQWKIVADALTEVTGSKNVVWDKLYAILYGEQRSPAIRSLYPLFDQRFDLNQRFEADLFSVISYGSYSDVVVALSVVVQRRKTVENGVERVYGFVKRVYWMYDTYVVSSAS